MIYQFLPVDRVRYGINVVEDGLIAEAGNRKRILMVTTNSIVKTEAYCHMLESLRENGFEVYETCSKQHVPGEVLLADLNEIRRFKPNLIISCGGGSPIDAAKILSMVLAEGIQSEDELYQYSDNLAEKKLEMLDYIPHFSIPTTLSASEFTSIAGVTNGSDHVKYKFSHLHMTPKVVFLDPVFTKETPDWLWISTGIRAVDHAVETLYSPNPNPINTGLALQALKQLYEYLPLTKKMPENLEYRLQCQIGAWLSLFSVVNIKLGLSHSIGHQLGALFNIPHGMTSAIMLPHVMEYLLPRTYREQAQLVRFLSEDRLTGEEKTDASKAPVLIKGLIESLEIPHRIRDFDVSPERMAQVVDNILIDIHGEENAFVLNTDHLKADITKLLEKAW